MGTNDFDFWIGEWDVFGPQGQQVGTNEITPLLEGQTGGMLHEHWHGKGGVEGRSINAYDPARACWHQTWMDSTGGVLLLDGGLRDGSMVMEGWSSASDDELAAVDRQRITWTPSDDGVRQLWETSSDDGKSWTVAFDGRYVRRSTS